MEDQQVQYQAALDYLYSFVDFSLTKQDRYSAEHFDLRRMVDLMARLGDPQNGYPIVHIAGTKGKGSTAAFIESAARAAGYRTGLYTSPHLIEYTERMQVDRQPIPPGELVTLIEEIKPVVAQIAGLTTFEITTALAFLHFARSGVNFAVIEVGLGGRLDATNIVTPRVAVITSLSMDHMNILGSTLAAIAGEKAGIIKPGIPVVSSAQKPEAREVLEKVAALRGSPLTFVDACYRADGGARGLDGQELVLSPLGGEKFAQVFKIPLLGRHQLENAATAFTALQVANAQGLPVSQEAIREGFAAVEWEGRFELLSREPWLLVDCAHNLDSAGKLRQTLQEYFPGREIVLVFGASEDKDVHGMMAELAPMANLVIATQSTHPRAMPPAEIAALARQFGKKALALDTIEAAVNEAAKAVSQDGLIVATGSIFVAAAVRQVWKEKQNKRAG